MKTYKRKLKLKESVKDGIFLILSIILLFVGAIMLVNRVNELDHKDSNNYNHNQSLQLMKR